MKHDEDTRSIDAVRGQEGAAQLRRLAQVLLSNAAEADDLVQDVWLAALRGRFEIVNFASWSRGVARKLAAKRHRGHQRRLEREKRAAREEATTDVSDLDRDGVRARLRDAVSNLGAPYREVLELRFWEDLEVKDIARRLDRPEGTVKSQLHRGLSQLRASLDAEYGDRRAWGVALVGAFEWRREDLARTAGLGAGAGVALLTATHLKVLAAVLLIASLGVLVSRTLPGDRATALSPAQPDAGSSTAVAGANTPPRGELESVDPVVLATREEALSQSPPAPPAAEVSEHVETPTALARVQTPAGDPVPGARVYQEGRSGRRELGVTDAAGSLSFSVVVEDLPSGAPRTTDPELVLFALAPGYAATERVHWKWTGPTTFVLEVQESEAVVRGLVTDDGGVPLPGVSVGLMVVEVPRQSRVPGISRSRADLWTETDAAGRFELGHLPVREQRLVARAQGWVHKPTIVDGARANLEEVHLVLHRGATLRGIVSEADGAPVQGAQLHFGLSPEARFDSVVTTDSEGRYEFNDAPTDPASLWVRAPDGRVYRDAYVPVPDEDWYDIALPRERSYGARLVDEHGMPLPAVPCYFSTYGWKNDRAGQIEVGWRRPATSDEEGLVELEILHESSRPVYLYALQAGQILPVGWARWGEPGWKTIVCRAEPERRGTLELLIRPAAGDELSPEAMLSFVDDESLFCFGGRLDADGRHVSPPLNAGSYSITLTGPGGEQTLVRTRIEPGTHLDLGTFDIPPECQMTIDWTWPGNPEDYEVRVLQSFSPEGSLLPTPEVFRTSADRLPTLHLVPGRFIFLVIRNGEVVQARFCDVAAGMEQYVVLGPDAPAVGVFEVSVSAEVQEVTLDVYRVDPERHSPAAEIDDDSWSRITAEGELEGSQTDSRGRVGKFYFLHSFYPGRYAVLATARDGRRAGFVLEVPDCEGIVHGLLEVR